jgi:hypothetical protein
MIYTIAGGTGKRRMNADASMRDGYSWSTFAILSGECSLEEKIRSDGGPWVAGMAVRMVDVDVSDVNRSVAAETLQRIGRIEDHHGHAGPLFVEKLVEHGLHRQVGALRERVASASRHLAGDAADGATVRAATPFALLLIAGELAKGFGLIPPSTAVEEAVRWAWDRFRSSPDSAALDPGAHAIASIRAWIAERWDVTIKPTKGCGGATSREAHGWYDDRAVYIPKDRIREAAGDALKASHIGKLLHERGLLAQRPEPDRYTIGWVPNIGAVECYALRRSAFGRSEHEVDPDTYVVHHGARHA